ncbi:acetyl-CoA carboxylase [uncultured Limosilactobacillus sp.]|uniref:acetyl-CoA carboxylase n=1 Tax=uncultured Limosilactobacillus sp. TaxID=2837629 RepID=UPI0025ED38F0|nr:acetyl-CoA carboxylase [uncultured Limosilactobacillus sp.]
MPHHESASAAAKLILKRIYDHFDHHLNVRYRILIVNDTFNQQYNWFLEWQRPGHRTRSVPLHSLAASRTSLPAVVRLVRQGVGMTIAYRGFAHQR